MQTTRRDFLKSVGGLGAAAVGLGISHGAGGEGNAPVLPKRQFGKHADQLSVIGFGGIVVRDATPDEARARVADFVEKGGNYFDVAPSYGNSEEKLGSALEPYRKNSFLACKTGKRDAEAARVEFENSLRTLRTDYFDLYQLHSITDVVKDVDASFAKGGVMEFVDQMRKEGRIRYVGFSAHSIEAATTALDRYAFDSVLFPVNFVTWMEKDFGPQVLKLATERGAAKLALKAMAKQRWAEGDPAKEKFKKCWYEPLADDAEIELALRFTLSQGVTAAIPPGDEYLFAKAVDFAMRFQPLDEAGSQKLASMAVGLRSLFPAG
jgi:predicted aldo/keto reductase-like oxidoreductase